MHFWDFLGCTNGGMNACSHTDGSGNVLGCDRIGGWVLCARVCWGPERNLSCSPRCKQLHVKRSQTGRVWSANKDADGSDNVSACSVSFNTPGWLHLTADVTSLHICTNCLVSVLLSVLGVYSPGLPSWKVWNEMCALLSLLFVLVKLPWHVFLLYEWTIENSHKPKDIIQQPQLPRQILLLLQLWHYYIVFDIVTVAITATAWLPHFLGTGTFWEQSNSCNLTTLGVKMMTLIWSQSCLKKIFLVPGLFVKILLWIWTCIRASRACLGPGVVCVSHPMFPLFTAQRNCLKSDLPHSFGAPASGQTCTAKS